MVRMSSGEKRINININQIAAQIARYGQYIAHVRKYGLAFMYPIANNLNETRPSLPVIPQSGVCPNSWSFWRRKVSDVTVWPSWRKRILVRQPRDGRDRSAQADEVLGGHHPRACALELQAQVIGGVLAIVRAAVANELSVRQGLDRGNEIFDFWASSGMGVPEFADAPMAKRKKARR